MSTQQERRVLELLETGLALEDEAREAWLESLKPTETDEVVSRLAAVLGSEAKRTRFLETRAATGAAGPLPTAIGPYRISRLLGVGGMGSVYLANRVEGAFEQQVAIKTINRAIDRQAVFGRFEREQRILASLDHPHIARLIDGGVTDGGVPYFVMEYVEGVSIDEYVQAQSLSVADVVALFVEVCSAVQAAHDALVIHRDLKPGNVLVTADGAPKLLDFGIARQSDEDGDLALTRTEFTPMTPSYASPEQLRRETLTTASDVYALGVLLYQLLSGERPYELDGLPPTRVETLICHEDPPPVSRRVGGDQQRVLAGDLDNIVAKAMHKDAQRRYRNAAELGADLQRHLGGYPVLATPDSAMYRVGKFVRRHTAGFAISVASIALLIGATTTSLWYANEARRAEDKASHINAFLQGIMLTPNPYHDSASGVTSNVPMADVTRAAGERLEHELFDHPEAKAQLYLTLARSLYGMGQFDEALPLHDKALALVNTLDEVDPTLGAESHYFKALTLFKLGQLDDARGLLEEAQRYVDAHYPPDSELKAWIVSDLAVYHSSKNELSEAIGYSEQGIDIQTRRLAGQPDAVLALMVANHGAMLALNGNLKASRERLSHSLEIYDDLPARDYVEKATSHSWLARVYRLEGELDTALAHAVKAEAIAQQIIGRDNPDYEAFASEYPRCLIELGRVDEAEAFLDHARELVAELDSNAFHRQAAHHYLAARIAHARGDTATAEAEYLAAEADAAAFYTRYGTLSADIDLAFAALLNGAQDGPQRLARASDYLVNLYGADFGYVERVLSGFGRI